MRIVYTLYVYIRYAYSVYNIDFCVSYVHEYVEPGAGLRQ